jgi:molecular chaperone GrpE (heat shock protein)
MDIEAVGKEIGRARRELDIALQPLQRRAAAAAKTMIADFAENAKTLRESNGRLATQIQEERKITEERREAIKGFTLADLAAASGTTDLNPEMKEEV